MTTATTLAAIEELGVIPSVRVPSEADARFAIETIHAAGFQVVELTMTTPGALELLAALRKSLPGLVVGAGTVMDAATARKCIDAGAAFITSPGLDGFIVHLAIRHRVLPIPGVLTPTEIMAARQSGASVVKVFPCAHIGGAQYIRSLKGPFPDTQIIAAGGVTHATAAEYIHAGAIAVGVGGELVAKHAVRERNRDWITELAHRFRFVVQNARATRPGDGHAGDT